MKSTTQTISKKAIKNTSKDYQELQAAWEKTSQKLKNSSLPEDQLLYNFLEANYLDPQTGLITHKKRPESHSISCKAKDFRPVTR